MAIRQKYSMGRYSCRYNSKLLFDINFSWWQCCRVCRLTQKREIRRYGRYGRYGLYVHFLTSGVRDPWSLGFIYSKALAFLRNLIVSLLSRITSSVRQCFYFKGCLWLYKETMLYSLLTPSVSFSVNSISVLSMY